LIPFLKSVLVTTHGVGVLVCVLLFSFCLPLQADLSQGLVAWYPLDQNASDISGRKPTSCYGTIVGEFNATDPDGDAITYHFVNGENNNSFFTLDTNGTLKTATTFDYESNASSFTITVQAKDELNATTEGNFTVTCWMCMRIPMGMDFGIPWKPQPGAI
jgi:hypothetical protein